MNKELEQALELITYDMVKGLTYEDELPLTNEYIIRHYDEEDLIVVVAEEEWEEVATVLYNDETKSVVFEMY